MVNLYFMRLKTYSSQPEPNSPIDLGEQDVTVTITVRWALK